MRGLKRPDRRVAVGVGAHIPGAQLVESQSLGPPAHQAFDRGRLPLRPPLETATVRRGVVEAALGAEGVLFNVGNPALEAMRDRRSNSTSKMSINWCGARNRHRHPNGKPAPYLTIGALEEGLELRDGLLASIPLHRQPTGQLL